jgi:hypothetical protein
MKTTIARAAAVAALPCAVPAAAQAPAFVPVQGVLRDSVGGTVDGAIPVSVRLYRNATGGAPFYVESSDVTFDDSNCRMYIGWSDSGRGCCDGLVYGTTTGALQGGFASPSSGIRRHVWESVVNFQGINLGGDVGDDDSIYVGFHCF